MLPSAPTHLEPGPTSSVSDPGLTSAADGAAKKRGSVACRRCRRLRTKCIIGGDAAGNARPTSLSAGGGSRPPCDGCRAAGVADDCSYPRRGEKDVDRAFRRRPMTRDAASLPMSLPLPLTPGGLEAAVPPSAAVALHPGADALITALPPHEEIVEGCRTFINSYFQLGFLPKAIFIEGLAQSPASVSPFLLCCILSISARFTPALIQRYGSAGKATDSFLAAARSMVSTEMYKPSLEGTQAFFLLAISEWGNGDKDRSSMDMGVAVRMATLLKLHREETYQLPGNATGEQIVRAESARRTFWMIQSQENLHSGYSTPSPFPLDDITAYLPCDEPDFAFGIVSGQRSVLEGTPPALANPHLATSSQRCLFATLVQAHNIWGQIARRACRPVVKFGNGNLSELPPWDNRSEFAVLVAKLRSWEATMPARHKWSVWNLRGWRAESLHLAYLAVVMVLRLSNIVARRVYLEDMLATLNPETSSQEPLPPSGFWSTLSNDLFSNVYELFEQIDSYFSMRTKEEGFPAILVFSVYICGSLLSYLWKVPQLCPQMASGAEKMALRALHVLSELHQAWPTCTRWQKTLQQIASPISSPRASGENDITMGDAVTDSQDSRYTPDTLQAQANLSVAAAMDEFPAEIFDAELNAFLTGGLHYGLGEWETQGRADGPAAFGLPAG